MTSVPQPPPGFVRETPNVRNFAPPPPPGFARPSGASVGSVTSQGLSGVNEGIANTIGFPVDAVGNAINGVTGLINRGFGTGIPQVTDPALGSNFWKGVMSEPGMIQPPTGNNVDAAVRRVGQGVGEAAAAAPVAVAGAAAPLASLGWTMLSGAGSGAGGAVASAAAPGNTTADAVGSAIGGGLPLGLGTMATHSAAVRNAIESAPTTSELVAAAGQKYDQAAAPKMLAPGMAGQVTATAQETTDLADQLHKIAAADRSVTLPDGSINPDYSKVGHALATFDQYAGQPLTADYFKSVRSVLQDAASSPNKAERRVASQMLTAYDKFTGGLAPELNEGNTLYTRASRGKDLETLNTLAAAKANRSGQSLAEALIGKYGTLQDNIIKGKMYGYGSALTDAVTNVAEGSPLRRALVATGKAAPRNPFTWATTAGAPAIIGSAVGGPVGGAVAATGATLGAFTARALANSSTKKASELAAALARNGGPLPPVAPDARNLALAWLLAHGNQQQR